jgi:alkanesulfonate monooxygenase SsuD/methylene tetrahydromethanopterin reductase-like flavin-dependent oxidoreductase (luciferase family)
MTLGIPVGVELDGDGAHPAAWRAAHHSPAQLLAPDRLARTVLAAEAAGFSFATLTSARPGDGYPNVRARLDPVETASYLAAVTSRLGLVVETTVVGAEPFHLANRLASLDWAAQGRAGWAVAGYADAAAGEVRDVVDAVRALWDTWEDGVFLADEDTGRFLDVDRWHYADVRGELFSIKGPAITPRPPQGHLPVLGHGAAVDVVRVGGADVADAVRRADAARAAGAARVLLDVEVLLDAEILAPDRLAALDAATAWPRTDALRVVGSSGALRAVLRDLERHVDAVRIDPAVLDVDLPLLGSVVLGAPQGGHLRDVLGLPAAVNRFTERRARSQQEGDAA